MIGAVVTKIAASSMAIPIGVVPACARPVTAGADALPSWRDGPAKAAIRWFGCLAVAIHWPTVAVNSSVVMPKTAIRCGAGTALGDSRPVALSSQRDLRHRLMFW